MKKLYLTLSILFIGILTIQAQFTVATHDGTPITDGSIFTFSELGLDADLSFDVTNTGSIIIDMRLEYVDMTNGDGSGTNLCVFGSCLPPGALHIDDIYPLDGISNDFTLIDPGETGSYDDHFFNTDPGDGTNYPIDYVFRFFEVDGNGDPITFTYRYDGTVSVEDMTQVNYKLYPTISSDFINLEINEAVSARLVNTQGQLIKLYSFEAGTHTIDLSSFSKQLYYFILTNKKGQQSLSKIIVK